MVLYLLYSFQLILSFWVNFSTKLVQIMTQEFAKNTNSRTTRNDSPPFFPQKKPKKACILLRFCIIILFKEETISYHLSI